MMLIIFFFALLIHTQSGVLALPLQTSCSTNTLYLWVNPGSHGDGADPSSPAGSLDDLYTNKFQGDQPIIVTFLGGPNFFSKTSPDYYFTRKCGVSFIGVDPSIVISSNNPLSIEDGFGPVVIQNLTFEHFPSGAIRPGKLLLPNIGDVTLDHVTFTDCSSASTGGSVFLDSISSYALKITSTRFLNSNGENQGGALWVRGGLLKVSVFLTDVEFSNCSVGGILSQGGGAYFTGVSNIQLTRISVHDCHADGSGAGLYISARTATISDSDFYCNQGGLPAAAIDFDRLTLTVSAQIKYSSFYNNTAGLCDNKCDVRPTTYRGTGLDFTHCSDCCMNNGVAGRIPTLSITIPNLTTTITLPLTLTLPFNETIPTTLTPPISLPTSQGATQTTSPSSSNFTTSPVSSLLTSTTTTTTTTTTCSPFDCSCFPTSSCETCRGSNCPTLVVPGSPNSTDSNTAIIVTSSNLTLVSTVNGSRMPYTLNWGSIREIHHSTHQIVKEIDLQRIDLARAVITDTNHTIIAFNGTASYDNWRSHPIQLTLTAIYFHFPSSNLTTDSLKLSISLKGSWQFNSTKNKLHVDFSIYGAYQPDHCGRLYQHLGENRTTTEFEIYGPNRSATHYSFVKYCTIDQHPKPKSMSINPPTFNNGTIIYELIFPPFLEQLDYDPSFAILLGSSDSSGSCSESIFHWILPAAFLAGAGVIVVLAIILGSTPWFSRFVLGKEGYRVYKLRKVTARSSDIEMREPPVNLEPEESGW